MASRSTQWWVGAEVAAALPIVHFVPAATTPRCSRRRLLLLLLPWRPPLRLLALAGGSPAAIARSA